MDFVDALRFVLKGSFTFVVFTKTMDHLNVGKDGKGVSTYHNLALKGIWFLSYLEEGFTIGTWKAVVSSGDAVGEVVVTW